MRTVSTHRHAGERPARISLLGSCGLLMLLVACEKPERTVAPHERTRTPGAPRFTLGAGSQSTLLGRATIADPFRVTRTTGAWEMDVGANGPVDVAVQSITFQPGGHSGWHRHPGPVFIQVVSGRISFYESDDPTCTPIIRTAGQGYLDTGEHAHMARNETWTPATNVVTYFAPPGEALRIDMPTPGNCPF